LGLERGREMTWNEVQALANLAGVLILVWWTWRTR
jgi:hypothetical protein